MFIKTMFARVQLFLVLLTIFLQKKSLVQTRELPPQILLYLMRYFVSEVKEIFTDLEIPVPVRILKEFNFVILGLLLIKLYKIIKLVISSDDLIGYSQFLITHFKSLLYIFLFIFKILSNCTYKFILIIYTYIVFLTLNIMFNIKTIINNIFSFTDKIQSRFHILLFKNKIFNFFRILVFCEEL